MKRKKAKYSQSDYTINWSVLEQAYNDGLTAIDASKTTSAVDTAKQAAIAAMAAVKTDAEELEAAKSAAKDELKEYFDAFNKAYYYETSLQAFADGLRQRSFGDKRCSVRCGRCDCACKREKPRSTTSKQT